MGYFEDLSTISMGPNEIPIVDYKHESVTHVDGPFKLGALPCGLTLHKLTADVKDRDAPVHVMTLTIPNSEKHYSAERFATTVRLFQKGYAVANFIDEPMKRWLLKNLCVWERTGKGLILRPSNYAGVLAETIIDFLDSNGRKVYDRPDWYPGCPSGE